MWFKNLMIYRLPAPWAITAKQLDAQLATQFFTPCSSAENQSQGWDAPRGESLVHTVNGQFLINLATEKKLLPASVINQVAKARAAEIEEHQGFKPGRKLLKEIKEQVTEDLITKAFSIKSNTHVWIDPKNGWLCIDTSSPSKSDDVLKMLLKTISAFPVEMLRVMRSPVSAMTDWLAGNEAPIGFTIDQDTELRSSAQSKATVRYVRHTLDPKEISGHIASGKQCTKLAMTWRDKISFVLTESLTVRRIQPLNVLIEKQEAQEDDQFDSDFALMCGELNNFFADLVTALSVEKNEQSA